MGRAPTEEGRAAFLGPCGCPGSVPTCITLGDAPLYKGGALGTGTAVTSRSQEAEMAADVFAAVGH